MFEKGLGFHRRVVEQIHLVGVIMRLDVEEVGICVLGRSVIEPRFFVRGKFCLQCRGDFLREIGLNGKNVSQIAIVIFRPKVLVVAGID